VHYESRGSHPTHIGNEDIEDIIMCSCGPNHNTPHVARFV